MRIRKLANIMSNIFFTSDTHFYHLNCIKNSQRTPWLDPSNIGPNGKWIDRNKAHEDMLRMNSDLIKNWNSRITKEDIVYFLGDFSWAKKYETYTIINQLNFKRLNFVYGNHDFPIRQIQREVSNHRCGWPFWNSLTFLGDYAEAKIDNQWIVMCHYPLVTWNKKAYGGIHLNAHCHNNMFASRKEGKCLGKILDVGVDGNNYFPYEFSEIRSIMGNKPINSDISELKDHHDER